MLFWAQNSDIRTLCQTARKERAYQSEGKMKIKDSQKYPSISVFDLETLMCGVLPFFFACYLPKGKGSVILQGL